MITEEIRNRIEQYGVEIDHLSIGREYDNLKLLINGMEQFKITNDDIKNDAAFNYYLGTAYGTYCDHFIRTGKNQTNELIDNIYS